MARLKHMWRGVGLKFLATVNLAPIEVTAVAVMGLTFILVLDQL